MRLSVVYNVLNWPSIAFGDCDRGIDQFVRVEMFVLNPYPLAVKLSCVAQEQKSDRGDSWAFQLINQKFRRNNSADMWSFLNAELVYDHWLKWDREAKKAPGETSMCMNILQDPCPSSIKRFHDWCCDGLHWCHWTSSKPSLRLLFYHSEVTCCSVDS